MATCAEFREFARDALRRGVAEIGAHPHAWSTPPLSEGTRDNSAELPYLTHYDHAIMRNKLHYLTSELEDMFGTRIVSHRSGRWALSEGYVRLLIDRGYAIDCSVTPHITWGIRGTEYFIDYSDFPDREYYLNPDDIRRRGHSSLLEIPMTIARFSYSPVLEQLRRAAPQWLPVGRAIGRLFPETAWLRPTNHNLRALMSILQQATRQRRSYVQFMLHSSELMPGGSPYFSTHNAVERLYGSLTTLFAEARRSFDGSTLAEFGSALSAPSS